MQSTQWRSWTAAVDFYLLYSHTFEPLSGFMLGCFAAFRRSFLTSWSLISFRVLKCVYFLLTALIGRCYRHFTPFLNWFVYIGTYTGIYISFLQNVISRKRVLLHPRYNGTIWNGISIRGNVSLFKFTDTNMSCALMNHCCYWLLKKGVFLLIEVPFQWR